MTNSFDFSDLVRPVVDTDAGQPTMGVIEALQTYRSAEAAMRRRTGTAMGLGENDLLALRFILDQHEAGRVVASKDVTRYLGISSASTTVLLDRLERSGQMRREHSPFDRRALILVPTATTDEEVRAALGDVPERMVGVANQLTADQAAVVIEFLRNMREAVDEIDADAAAQNAPSRRS